MAYIQFDYSVPVGFQIIGNKGQSIVVDSDWNYPAIANKMGLPPCPCGSSDGTVDCCTCDKTAIQMITEAYDFIQEHQNINCLELDEYVKDVITFPFDENFPSEEHLQ